MYIQVSAWGVFVGGDPGGGGMRSVGLLVGARVGGSEVVREGGKGAWERKEYDREGVGRRKLLPTAMI